MPNVTDSLSKLRLWTGRSFAALNRWWRQLGGNNYLVADTVWRDAFLKRVFQQYHFTAETAAWLMAEINIEVLDKNSLNGGGLWIPSENCVRLYTAQDEAAVHELSHAWWHYRRQGQADALIEAVIRAASEPDRCYARVQDLAHGYVYGTLHDGWPGMLVDRNDWEMFAGLASGTMGDMSLVPPYLRRFYDGLFYLPDSSSA